MSVVVYLDVFKMFRPNVKSCVGEIASKTGETEKYATDMGVYYD